MTLLLAAHPIVHVNASLNALATLLLLAGLYFIKQGDVNRHKIAMIMAYLVSIAFLICYVWYHIRVGRVEFKHSGAVRFIYYSILASHVILAMAVPFLATRQLYLGFRAIGCCNSGTSPADHSATAALYRDKHIRLARITFPIWLYVSITGVVVYVMLYHLWPPSGN